MGTAVSGEVWELRAVVSRRRAQMSLRCAAVILMRESQGIANWFERVDQSIGTYQNVMRLSLLIVTQIIVTLWNAQYLHT